MEFCKRNASKVQPRLSPRLIHTLGCFRGVMPAAKKKACKAFSLLGLFGATAEPEIFGQCMRSIKSHSKAINWRLERQEWGA
jgi:hypothetical protein